MARRRTYLMTEIWLFQMIWLLSGVKWYKVIWIVGEMRGVHHPGAAYCGLCPLLPRTGGGSWVLGPGHPVSVSVMFTSLQPEAGTGESRAWLEPGSGGQAAEADIAVWNPAWECWEPVPVRDAQQRDTGASEVCSDHYGAPVHCPAKAWPLMVTLVTSVTWSQGPSPGSPASAPPPVTRVMTRPLASSFEKCVFQRILEQSECLLPGTKFKHELDSREESRDIEKRKKL